MEVLELFVRRRRDIEHDMERLTEMYDRFLGDSQFYHTATFDDIMQSFTRWPEEERLHRMEMLAQLYYVEGGMKTGLSKDMLLEKALHLFRFIDRHSRTYSIDRINKISEIQKRLG